MSFTFRNLFSEEEGESTPDSLNDGLSSGPQQVFTASEGDGVRGSQPSKEQAVEPNSMRIQAFLVSELLPFIPPAIAARSGIPMQDELDIVMPENGSNDVRLSEVYQICPELFAAEITPLNDSVITLPAKLGEFSAEPESNESEAEVKLQGAAFGSGSLSKGIASHAVSSEQTDGSEDANNPFWSPEPLSGGGEADGAVMAEAEVPAMAEATGFKPATVESEVSGAANDGEAAVSGGFFGGIGEPLTDETESISAGFGTPVQPSDSQNFNIDLPENEESPLSETPDGVNAFEGGGGFSTHFSDKAQDDMEIPFPGAESMNQGESMSTEWGKMFQAGFDAETSEAVNEPSVSGFGDMINDGGPESIDGGIQEKDDPKTEAAPASAMGFDSPLNKAGNESEAFLAASQEIANGFAADYQQPANASDPISSSFSGFESPDVPAEISGFGSPDVPAEIAEPAENIAFSGEGFAPEKETEKETEMVLEEESQVDKGVVNQAATVRDMAANVSVQVAGHSVAPMPVSEPARIETPSAPIQGDGEDYADLEMRAIFSSSESFTLSRLARKIVELPGMQGCALATPSHLVQASKSEENRLGDEAEEMVNTVKNLAKLTGLPDAKTFTLQTDRGIVSLFMEGDCCLIVRHDEGSFEAGVREKLIVISRNMHKLSD